MSQPSDCHPGRTPVRPAKINSDHFVIAANPDRGLPHVKLELRGPGKLPYSIA